MKMHRVLTAGLLTAGLLLACVPAGAVKLEMRMSPQTLAGNGFKLTAREEDGTVRFQLTRDLSKTQWPGRSAYLTIGGEAGTIARCEVAGEKQGNNLVYRFSIAPENARRSRLTYTEVQTGPGEEKLIGGGTYFEFNLADYVGKAGGK